MAKIEWKGGECPVSGDTRVSVYFRDGVIDENSYASDWRWQHIPRADDIIAYEVIEEPKQITEKTLRDEFAMAYIAGGYKGSAYFAYEFADEMMKARAKWKS